MQKSKGLAIVLSSEPTLTRGGGLCSKVFMPKNTPIFNDMGQITAKMTNDWMTPQFKKNNKTTPGFLSTLNKPIPTCRSARDRGQTAAAVCFYTGLAKDDGKQCHEGAALPALWKTTAQELPHIFNSSLSVHHLSAKYVFAHLLYFVKWNTSYLNV